MISGVSFNDHPTLHDLMASAGRNEMVVVRIKVDDKFVEPSTIEMLTILRLQLVDKEYLKFLSVYYDHGDNVEQFKRYAINRLKNLLKE